MDFLVRVNGKLVLEKHELIMPKCADVDYAILDRNARGTGG
jgi:hypothetical protein